jgi:hypothetical protein
VQRAGNARSLQRFLVLEFLANGHQARHFGFGDDHFLAAPRGERQVGNGEILALGGRYYGSIHQAILSVDRDDSGGQLDEIRSPERHVVQRARLGKPKCPSLAGRNPLQRSSGRAAIVP